MRVSRGYASRFCITLAVLFFIEGQPVVPLHDRLAISTGFCLGCELLNPLSGFLREFVDGKAVFLENLLWVDAEFDSRLQVALNSRIVFKGRQLAFLCHLHRGLGKSTAVGIGKCLAIETGEFALRVGRFFPCLGKASIDLLKLRFGHAQYVLNLAFVHIVGDTGVGGCPFFKGHAVNGGGDILRPCRRGKNKSPGRNQYGYFYQIHPYVLFAKKRL
ncbi:hypothetical protein Avi_4202 [Allorhizobium ampelinum S4]|uniref:Uncharacterized protein n=1 Tax=Allorhizobium ampelinum (strain ATCC BAA-846 / DSM 112012 / S4) TaxID=311402 RepID=B9JUC1_ALLAM|nr:hypothetical protein Avi_4202 [Allorhizobium ampelinum S4]